MNCQHMEQTRMRVTMRRQCSGGQNIIRALPAKWDLGHTARPSAVWKSHGYYTTTYGTKVYNDGATSLDMCTLHGKRNRPMTFQVAQVEKAVACVMRTTRVESPK